MTQVYSDPSREDEPTALPDVEVFYHDSADAEPGTCWFDDDGEALPSGWYYWCCFPGCLPDGDPIGPFKTEAEATEDAQAQAAE